MSVDVASFRARFPEFSSSLQYSDGLLDSVIQEAYLQISPTWFGALSDSAQLYLAAHILTSTVGAKASGVHQVSAGQTNLTYDLSTGFKSTGYGQQYLRLARLRGGAQIVSGGGR